jgi:hypothetical protein
MVSDTGKTKLSPSMYMHNMIKICAALAYWLLVVGARAAAIDLATAMDNHCRNRSASVMQVVGIKQSVSINILFYMKCVVCNIQSSKSY